MRVPGRTPDGVKAVGSTIHVVSVHRLFLTVVVILLCRPICRMFKLSDSRAGVHRPLRLEPLHEVAKLQMIRICRRTVDPLRPLRLEVHQVPDRPPVQARVDHVRVAASYHVFVVQFAIVFLVSVLVNSVA